MTPKTLMLRNLPSGTQMATGIGGMSLSMILLGLLIYGQLDLVCAILILLVLLTIALHDKITGIIATLGYLTVMGDVRRMVAAAFGQPQLDLLLLVAPAISIMFAVPSLFRAKLQDLLSKAVLALMFVMILQVFNPKQGGIAIGVSGGLFYLVPVLWFWIGRQFATPRVVERLLYRCLLPLAIASALMGLCQTFIGFLPYQQSWISSVARTYTALHLGNSIRAFGLSVSASEYGTLLTFATAAIVAAFIGNKRVWIIAAPLLFVAVILVSSRGLIVKLVFALAIVWTLRARHRLDPKALLRLGIFTVVGLLVTVGVAARFSAGTQSTGAKGSAANQAVEHQVDGLAHPLDERKSTIGIHTQLLGAGILQGFVAPLGHGLGSTTEGARKFGGDSSTKSSEIDFSDMFISLGLIGGLIYIFVIIETVRRLLAYLETVPTAVGLPVLAILATTISSWLIAGQYSTSSIVFFLIGSLVRSSDSDAESLLFREEPGNGPEEMNLIGRTTKAWHNGFDRTSAEQI